MNVVLDLLFVAGMGYGAAGAAAATAISQAAMAVYVIVYTVRKYPFLKFSFAGNLPDKTVWKSGAAYGLPSAVQSGVSSVGNIYLQQFMNGFGEQTGGGDHYGLPGRYCDLPADHQFRFGDRDSRGAEYRCGKAGAGKAGLPCRHCDHDSHIPRADLPRPAARRKAAHRFWNHADTAAIGREFFHSIARFYIIYGISMAVRGCLEGRGRYAFLRNCGYPVSRGEDSLLLCV